MALSKLSEVGGKVIQGNWDDELIITGIADGTAKAGHVVALVHATGVVDGFETTIDGYAGILLPHHKIDVDAAITSTYIVSIVVPQPGHIYAILCGDPGDHVVGWGMIPSANAGLLASATDVANENIICRLYKWTSGDTVALVIWGG